jgi:hypothetical protein
MAPCVSFRWVSSFTPELASRRVGLVTGANQRVLP